MLINYIISFVAFTTVNSLNQCVSNYTDLGPTLIRQLYSEINQAECELYANVNYYNYEADNFERFDFVVIGAGTAGSVVANRLSENNKWKVLVLEAGGDPTITSEIPAFGMMSWGTELDWNFKTEPKENIFLGLKNRISILPRGKVLGGTSILNYMLYLRGNPKDYDHWAELGNNGWSYNELLPLFKKTEDMRDPEILANPNFDKYHGIGGLLSIESYNYVDESGFLNIFKTSMKELGYDYFSDANADQQRGLFRAQGTLRNKKRCSSAKAFLLSAQNRPNLKISKHSEVTKILIQNNVARGVQYKNKQGQLKYVLARKEVILSAGSINSPKVLMLSGVGPKEHLNEMKIKTIQNLKVGENYQDHVLFPLIFVTHNLTSNSSTNLSDQIFQYLTKSSGPLGGINTVCYPAFINITADNYPEVQILHLNFGVNEVVAINQLFGNFGVTENVSKLLLKINSNSPITFFIVILLRPKSRGKILLENSDPKTNPKIINGYLTDKDDWEVLLKGIDFMLKLTETDAMKSVGAKMHEIPMEECKGFPSREYWRCTIRYFATSGYHQTGSCKMGPATDPDAVVDSRLRVRGVNNLRVVDLSITPQIVSASTQAAAFVIGEKGAELIKEDTK